MLSPRAANPLTSSTEDRVTEDKGPGRSPWVVPRGVGGEPRPYGIAPASRRVIEQSVAYVYIHARIYVYIYNTFFLKQRASLVKRRELGVPQWWLLGAAPLRWFRRNGPSLWHSTGFPHFTQLHLISGGRRSTGCRIVPQFFLQER